MDSLSRENPFDPDLMYPFCTHPEPPDAALAGTSAIPVTFVLGLARNDRQVQR
jgi:hypothetical protein